MVIIFLFYKKNAILIIIYTLINCASSNQIHLPSAERKFTIKIAKITARISKGEKTIEIPKLHTSEMFSSVIYAPQ